jgi:phage terminase large subunit
MKVTLPHKWTPRAYQLPCWDYFQKGGTKKRKRALCVWPRRHGKDLFAINLVADSIFERVGTYWHVFPEYKQGRAAMWDGMTMDGRRFLDYFPKEIIKRRYENDMRIHFMHPEDPDEEGSVYRIVGADNASALVGTNPIGVIYSEYALQDPSVRQYISPILLENDGWELIISTVRGHNHLYDLHALVKNDPAWFVEILSSRTTKRDDGLPVMREEDIAQERKQGIPEEIIQQEYYSNWDAPLVGAYYSPQMDAALKDGRIGNVPIEPKCPMNTAWDIGRDTTAIIFFQEVGLEIRIVDYYARAGEAMPHFVTVLRERGYGYQTHFLPWDIEITDWQAGKSRIETLRTTMKNNRVSGRVVPTQQYEKADGIEQCRNLFPRIIFEQARGQMALLIEALRSYRKKFDERLRVFSTTPLHDWSSHPADAFSIMCWNIKRRSMIREKPLPTMAIDDPDYKYL